MITWQLNRIMAEKRITAKKLAEELQFHPNTVYRLRKSENMPSIDGSSLNKLCNALDCTPSDLIEYTPDGAPIRCKSKLDQSDSSPAESSPATVAATAAVGAAQIAVKATGSRDPNLAAKVAASVMQVLMEFENFCDS